MPKRLEHTPTQSEAAFLEHIRTLHLPRYAELPPIDLYMDQVLTYVEEHLRPLISPEEKLLTSSMVNNYVKQHILPTPNRKRYTRDHIAYLISICLFKRTFSMGDIQKLLETQASTHTIARAYDFFCCAMEESLRTMFCGAADADRIGGWSLVKDDGFAFALHIENADELTPERRIALSAITCAANKIYVEKCFELDILAARLGASPDAENRETDSCGRDAQR